MDRPRIHIAFAVAAAVLALVAQGAEATICISEMITLRRIQGIVAYQLEDGAAEVLPGAVVKLSSGKYEAETTTDEDGYFHFETVRPGNYEIRAGLEGFVTAYGTVRVRRQGTEGRVLVIWLPIDFDSCGWVTTETFDKARRIQQGGRQ
jgi:hypothetical protein